MRTIKIIFSVILLACATHCSAQVPAPTTTSPSAGKVHALVPQEAVACLTVRMQQIKADQALRLLPWEIMTAASLDEVGIDLSELERVDLVIGPIAQPPGIGGILTSKNKLDLKSLNPERFRLDKGGEAYMVLGNRDLANLRIFPLNDNQVAVGVADTLPPLLNAPRGAGELQKQMQRLGENGHISLLFVPEPIRPMLLDTVENLPPQLQADAKAMVEKCQLIAARAQVNLSPQIDVLIETASPADAEGFETSWNRLVDSLVPQLINEIVQTTRAPSLESSMDAYGTRLSNELSQLLHPTRKGARLLLTIDQKAINLLRGLTTFVNFSELWKRTGGEAPINRTESPDTRKLMMIGLAMHNYESAYRCFPMGGDINQVNKPQLSWRVNILPFLGDPQSLQLYQQFKLEEPWDSEHNRKLVEKMPDIYRYSKANTPPGYTVVQMPLGPGLISEKGRKTKIASILDGTSNSIMVALSTDAAAVPWTKPEDFNPLENPALIRVDNNKSLLLFADGSVTERTNPTPEELKPRLTISGGEIIGD